MSMARSRGRRGVHSVQSCELRNVRDAGKQCRVRQAGVQQQHRVSAAKVAAWIQA